MSERYKDMQIPVKLLLDQEELSEIEGYRERFCKRIKAEIPTEEFIARMLEVGSGPHLKRQMEFYVDGKIDGKDIRNI